jgi:multidrug efflux pump
LWRAHRLRALRSLLAPLVRWQQRRAAVAGENASVGSRQAVGWRALRHGQIKGATGVYVRTLASFATNKVGNLVAIGCVIAIAFFSFQAFLAADNGVEFFVNEEPDIAILLISARGNLSAEETRDLVIEVEDRVLGVNGIQTLMTTTQPVGGGGGGGGDALGLTDVPPDMIGQIQIELADYSNRRSAAEIFEEINALTADLAGIRTEIREIEGGPPTGKDVTLELRSSNYDTLLATTRAVRAYVDTVDGLVDLEDDTPLPGIEWQIAIDREEAGRFGASIAQVGPMVQLVTTGVLIDTYRPDDTDEEVEIRVRLPEGQRTLEQLDDLRLETAHGQVPLSNFVRREAAPRVASITRIDGAYAMSVKANAAEGVDYNEKVAEIQAWIDASDRAAGHGVLPVPRRGRGAAGIRRFPHAGHGRLTVPDVHHPVDAVQLVLPNHPDARDSGAGGVRCAARHGGHGAGLLDHHDRDRHSGAGRDRGEQCHRLDGYVQPVPARWAGND